MWSVIGEINKRHRRSLKAKKVRIERQVVGFTIKCVAMEEGEKGKSLEERWAEDNQSLSLNLRNWCCFRPFWLCLENLSLPDAAGTSGIFIPPIAMESTFWVQQSWLDTQSLGVRRLLPQTFCWRDGICNHHHRFVSFGLPTCFLPAFLPACVRLKKTVPSSCVQGFPAARALCEAGRQGQIWFGRQEVIGRQFEWREGKGREGDEFLTPRMHT